MSKKQELSKLALAALLLAAASPTAIEAAAEFDAQPGIFLARACGATKCASLSPKEEIADNSSGQDSPYDAKHNTYEMKKTEKSTESSKGPSHLSEEKKSTTVEIKKSPNYFTTTEEPQSHSSEEKQSHPVDSKGRYYYFTTEEESQQILPSHQKSPETPKIPGAPDTEGKSAYGTKQPNPTDRNNPTNRPNPADRNHIAEGRGPTNAARSSSYYNSYNVNRVGGDTTPTYIDSYPSNPNNPGPNTQMRRNMDNNANVNRQYNTVNDYDYNRAVATTVNSSQTMNEAQLLGALNPQGRAMYLSLDPEGKALAIQLASEDSYKDKNLAIKEAQRRMNDRFGIINR